MAIVGKLSGFRKEGDNWFCSSSLPSDLEVVLDGVKFHLHKFPLISRCGKIAKMFEESETRKREQTKFSVTLEEFPGGADIFLKIVKFCYGSRLEFTSRNVVILYCAADYLEMTDEFGEDNLQSKLESFFHEHILKDWKDCVSALQSCEPFISRAEKLHLPGRCMHAMSVMISTDPSLFGWPMKMYGSFQSPGGSILWNGINTGAKLQSDESKWWFEDVSYIGILFFERLIRTLKEKGVTPKILAQAVMYYGTKYLPGLSRWQGDQASFSVSSSALDRRALLETVIKLVPEKRGKSYCRFLLGLLRNALIMGFESKFLDSLERKIGSQLEYATLDTLLIPKFSDSETLYDCECVERMLGHFVSSEVNANNSVSPPDHGASPFSVPMKTVSRLVDDYLAEVASDTNLKPEKFRRLAISLPDSSRTLHDGLYRALDIYLKEHSWLSEKESEHLCGIIDFEKLSVDACAHASQNERLPLRIVLQVLFFEQMHLRRALAASLNALGSDAPGPDQLRAISRENEVLKMSMDRMASRVDELEQEFSRIKEQVRKIGGRNEGSGSPRVSFMGMGCKLLAPSSDVKTDIRGSKQRRMQLISE